MQVWCYGITLRHSITPTEPLSVSWDVRSWKSQLHCYDAIVHEWMGISFNFNYRGSSFHLVARSGRKERRGKKREKPFALYIVLLFFCISLCCGKPVSYALNYLVSLNSPFDRKNLWDSWKSIGCTAGDWKEREKKNLSLDNALRKIKTLWIVSPSFRFHT